MVKARDSVQSDHQHLHIILSESLTFKCPTRLSKPQLITKVNPLPSRHWADITLNTLIFHLCRVLVNTPINVKKTNPSCKAAENTICFAKNPIKGGIPANENKVIAKLNAKILLIWKYPLS